MMLLSGMITPSSIHLTRSLIPRSVTGLLYYLLGVDNLFDEKFSSNISLNATGFGGNQPAFFNPSLDRNAYVGVGIKYLFN
jgi:hypothetical protein